MGTDKEDLIENEEQNEDTTVDAPQKAEETKPKEDSFWGFAVKKWESLTESSPPKTLAKKKEDKDTDGEEETGKYKEESFWDSALKKWDEVKESIAPSNKNTEDDEDSWNGRNNQDEMETFWADDEAQLCSENKSTVLQGNDPVYSSVMGIMSNARSISDKRTQAVKDLVPYVDPKELLRALRKLNTGKGLSALELKSQSMLARHLQDACSQKIFEFSRLPPQQRAEKFKLYKQSCQPVCILEQMATLDRPKKDDKKTRKLIGSFPLAEIAIHGEHLLVRQSMEDLSTTKKNKSSFGFFNKDSKTDKKSGKPSKKQKSFKAKLSSWLK